MTNERFSQLLKGPLFHPLPMFASTRLSLALMAVTYACDKQGADALEAFCDAPKPEARELTGQLSSDRFNELLDGPLRGEDFLDSVSKLAGALKYVVDTCGKRGDLMLETHCQEREAQDERNGEG